MVASDRSFNRCRSAFALRIRRLVGFALAVTFVVDVLVLPAGRRKLFEFAADALVVALVVEPRRSTVAFFFLEVEVRLLEAGLALAALTKARTNWSLRMAWTPVRPILFAIADRSLTV